VGRSKRASPLRESSGQVAILFGVILMLTTLMGVIAVDIGFLLAARRDAQGDADAIALAGAIELPDFEVADQADAATAAIAAARAWAQRNGVDPDNELALQVLWNDECYPGQGEPDEAYVGVKATVTREPFTVFLGFLPAVGSTLFDSTATACSGTPLALAGFMPWGLPQDGACFEDKTIGSETVRVPILGERCVLADAQSSGGPNYGQLGFDTSNDDCPDGSQSANDYEEAIIEGVELTCTLGQYASANSGGSVGKTRSGLVGRLTADGQCDVAYTGFQPDLTSDSGTFTTAGFVPLETPTIGDAIDDLFEVWSLPAGYDPTDPASGLQERDCDLVAEGFQSSARNITVLVIDAVDPADPHSSECSANTCYELLGFARMYLEGCSDQLGGDFSRTCDGLAGNDFIIYARLVSSVAMSVEALGFNRVGDVQTFLKE
jgi:hypothetical protein